MDPDTTGRQTRVDDLLTVVDHATAPIVSFKARKDGRLVVVTGTWSNSNLPSGCRVDVTARESKRRVVLEAQVDLTRLDQQIGTTCDPPDSWSTGTSYVVLDEPLGKRKVVTAGPVLEGVDESDPPGTTPVPRRR